jgi:hypothetical protein
MQSKSHPLENFIEESDYVELDLEYEKLYFGADT